jgi:hypothetical protein
MLWSSLGFILAGGGRISRLPPPSSCVLYMRTRSQADTVAITEPWAARVDSVLIITPFCRILTVNICPDSSFFCTVTDTGNMGDETSKVAVPDPSMVLILPPFVIDPCHEPEYSITTCIGATPTVVGVAVLVTVAVFVGVVVVISVAVFIGVAVFVGAAVLMVVTDLSTVEFTVVDDVQPAIDIPMITSPINTKTEKGFMTP